ncbi:hypothetical protein N7468_003096 [Penicillium chermesinum]|uniref:Uncharacterized protein n=1 Tax=Penicillium chermesinum TaxID=63820 RepID=A0A9W9TRI2_9EURO|nr:uncharacterized protein N7468_003096 [Penicillium chermesinum]KAJ5238477.1 hypothetical protein N7468_003096 [Penicillium chermesinum]KAJ6164135.1 hypothetical protein N7470_002807 [Penicillium chermesinum]
MSVVILLTVIADKVLNTSHLRLCTLPQLHPAQNSSLSIPHAFWLQRAKSGLLSEGISHIGQLFFDQYLISRVEATYPHNTSPVEITQDANDHVVKVETADSDSDPFFEHAHLGDTIEECLSDWVTLGIIATASQDSDATYPASLTSTCGVTNLDNKFGRGDF